MKRAAILAMLAALALGGCGSSQLSAPQLRSQADQICTTAAGRTRQIPSPGLSGGARFLSRGLDVLQPELARLRTLHPPARAAPTYGTALHSFAAELGAIEQTRRGLVHGAEPVTAFRSLQGRLSPLEASGDEAWRRLGIDSCVGA